MNALERVNKEVRRRTNIVDVFPNDESGFRIVDAILSGQHDQGQTPVDRYLIMTYTTVLDLEQQITVELEAT
jgi:transposase-like protein